MRTIALRFAEYFAPEEGTIKAHETLIRQIGFVWYGKMGNPVSKAVINQVMSQDDPRILLIHSGGLERYWAYIKEIQHSRPNEDEFPEYYRDKSDRFNTWFKVLRFEKAPRTIMAECTVASSGVVLSVASKHSMSPYFIIDVKTE